MTARSSTLPVAVVTGAARGIGLATARWFLANGYRVAMIDIDAKELSMAALAHADDARVLAVHCDVSNPTQVTESIARVEAHFGRIDALVNNAGVAVFKTLQATSFEEWRHVMATNLDGVFLCSQACVPAMLKGGGGSIVTVPVLIYVAGLPAREAVALSLAIVGATAAAGAVAHLRAGNTHLKAALVFGASGMVGAPFGARLTPLVPTTVLMLLFACLMIAVGLRMIQRDEKAEGAPHPQCHLPKCLLAGLGVGVLTGFLGVGGGFLIVPALLRFAKTPMREAVGTSLLIITASSFSGFLAHLGDFSGHLPLAAAFTGMALVGLVGGIALSRRMQPEGLKRAFGGLGLAVAVFLLAMNLGPALRLATEGAR
mgnify:CR=1 FL=1